MSRRYFRPMRRVPSPLRTLATVTLAWAIVAGCAIVAEVALWAEAHPWAVLIVGMLVAAVLTVRQSWRSLCSRRIKQPTTETVAPRLPEPAQQPCPPRPPHPPRPARQPAHPTQSASQVVYWGKQRVGTLDEQGTFRPDRHVRQS